tara:strand:+ start:235 stop:561 length:327 start_codon:yes stop_codon:yes gene_type:complete
VLEKVNQLLFFDNLALFYVLREIPPVVLARAFLTIDSRLSGSLLGLMDPEQRTMIHALMIKENDEDTEKNEQAAHSLIDMANELIKKGIIRQEGPHFRGVQAAEDAAE